MTKTSNVTIYSHNIQATFETPKMLLAFRFASLHSDGMCDVLRFCIRPKFTDNSPRAHAHAVPVPTPATISTPEVTEPAPSLQFSQISQLLPIVLSSMENTVRTAVETSCAPIRATLERLDQRVAAIEHELRRHSEVCLQLHRNSAGGDPQDMGTTTKEHEHGP